MPVYDLAAVAEALDLPSRQLDNILNRNDIPGVGRTGRGIDRIVTADAATIICLAVDLAACLEISASAAVQIAVRLERASPLRGEFAEVSVDLRPLRAAVARRLDQAVETVGKRKRGRPRRRAATSTTDE